MSEKIRLLVGLEVKPEEVDGFLKMFCEVFIPNSRAEAGCERYELWQDKEQPNKMTVIEIWADEAAFEGHKNQEWFTEWRPKLNAALVGGKGNVCHQNNPEEA